MLTPDGCINRTTFTGMNAGDSLETIFLPGKTEGICHGIVCIETNMPMANAYIVTVSAASDVLREKTAFWIDLYFQHSYTCTFLPHLSPQKHYVIGEKVLRGAPVILEDDNHMIAILPDYEAFKNEHPVPYLMDYDRIENVVRYGVGHHAEHGHTYFKLSGKKMHVDDGITFSFYIFISEKQSKTNRDYMIINRLIWEVFAKKEMALAMPDPYALIPYVRHTYRWAFHAWREVSWQEFIINEQMVGGIVFILTAKQKPGLGYGDMWREPKSLWNQAWFCSLRSAYGYYLWGKQNHDHDLMVKGKMALAFALSAPMNQGLFCSYYKAGENNDMSHGRFYTSAPRRPDNHEGYYHLLDCSWTCHWLLKWYKDIEKDERILPFVSKYLETLIGYQQPDGSFPAWVEPITGKISPYLLKSPEAACHLILLADRYGMTKEDRWMVAAKKTARFLIDNILPSGQWEDFETYWSCAGEWKEKQFGCVDKKSGLYNQNTLGMYWCAEGLLDMYRLTKDNVYLQAGERVIAEFSLYQQLYRPYGFDVETLGGFGVMNSDDEWNDARQSLFALTYLKYFMETGNEMYYKKALWSMKASFYMMYCPENAETKALYEKIYPYFNEMDYGFHMENYKHNDGTQNMGLGEFTIFDWGNGAACASLYEFIKLYKTIDNERRTEY